MIKLYNSSDSLGVSFLNALKITVFWSSALLFEVLNNTDYLLYYVKLTGESGFIGLDYPFDPKCLENLRTIVKATNSKIVISSSWRKFNDHVNKLFEVLKEYGLDKEVVGETPILNTSRGQEIGAYLKSLNTKCNFIILDDSSDMDEYLPHLVHTSYKDGLLEEHVIEAIAKLSVGMTPNNKDSVYLP